MKHAYLILAHNEYKVLQELVSSIDHIDNDIYIHIDKKVSRLPCLKTKYSQLFFIEERIKVYWGCLSVVEAETILIENAYSSNINYNYYHLLSGIHYPLKPIDKINEFYESKLNKNLVSPMDENQDSVNKRLGRYHLFLNLYTSSYKYIRTLFKLQWRFSIKLQKWLGIERNISYYSGKSSNWCSLTKEAVEAWLRDKKKIRKRFRWTFCPDEYVALCVLRENNLPVELCPNLLFQEFENGNPKVYKVLDFDKLNESNCLFGRKFTKESLSLIERIKDENYKDIRN